MALKHHCYRTYERLSISILILYLYYHKFSSFEDCIKIGRVFEILVKKPWKLMYHTYIYDKIRNIIENTDDDHDDTAWSASLSTRSRSWSAAQFNASTMLKNWVFILTRTRTCICTLLIAELVVYFSVALVTNGSKMMTYILVLHTADGISRGRHCYFVSFNWYHLIIFSTVY